MLSVFIHKIFLNFATKPNLHNFIVPEITGSKLIDWFPLGLFMNKTNSNTFFFITLYSENNRLSLISLRFDGVGIAPPKQFNASNFIIFASS